MVFVSIRRKEVVFRMFGVVMVECKEAGGGDDVRTDRWKSGLGGGGGGLVFSLLLRKQTWYSHPPCVILTVSGLQAEGRVLCPENSKGSRA